MSRGKEGGVHVDVVVVDDGRRRDVVGASAAATAELRGCLPHRAALGSSFAPLKHPLPQATSSTPSYPTPEWRARLFCIGPAHRRRQAAPPPPRAPPFRLQGALRFVESAFRGSLFGLPRRRRSSILVLHHPKSHSSTRSSSTSSSFSPVNPPPNHPLDEDYPPLSRPCLSRRIGIP